jgi:hypothetical protein
VTAKLRALPWVARNIFDGRIGRDDVLVDVGCGMAGFTENVARRFAGKGLTMPYLKPAFVEVFDHDPRFGTAVVELPILDPRIEGRQRRLAVVRLAPA